MLSSIVWILSGFVFHVGLGRLLGPVNYGILGVILSLVTINFLLLTNGTRQAIAKFTADSPERAGDIQIAGMKLQLMLAGILVCIFVFLAEPIAHLLNDKSLTNYIRVSSIIIPFIGIAFCCRGVFEGIKQIPLASNIGMAYSILRVTCVFLLVWLGYEVYGALVGMIVAAVLFALISLYFTKDLQKKAFFSPVKLLNFGIPVLVTSIAISLIMHIDILSVKSIMQDNAQAGYYTAASSTAKMIYSGSQAYSFILLPYIAQAIKNNDLSQARQYITKALRYMLMLLVPFSFLISATAKEVVVLCYGYSYAPAAFALSILVGGMALLTLFLSLSTMIQAFGRPLIPMYIISALVPVDIALNSVLVHSYGLQGAAIATSVTCGIGLVLAGVVVLRLSQVLIPPASVIRIVMTACVMYFVMQQITVSGLWLPPVYIAAFACYLGLLFITGEISKDDMKEGKIIVAQIKGRFTKKTQ